MIALQGPTPLGRIAASGPCHTPGLLPPTDEIETVTKADKRNHAERERERFTHAPFGKRRGDLAGS